MNQIAAKKNRRSAHRKSKSAKFIRHHAKRTRNGSADVEAFTREKSIITRRAAREAYQQLQRVNRRATETLARLGDEQAHTLDETRRVLKETQNRYADLYELAPIGFVTLDRLGRIEEINKMAATTLGRSRHALLKSPFALHVERKDLDAFFRHLLRCKQGQERVETELHLKSSGRAPIPVLLSTAPVSAAIKDGVVLYQTAIVDLTERKRAENAARESDERIRRIVEQTNAGIARYNENGDIEFANEGFCKMLVYKEAELIGKNIREITHADDIEKTIHAFERVLRKGRLTELEKRYIRKDGSVVWVTVSDALERDALGQPKSVVAVTVDITARKKAEAALQKSKELLEKLVHERTEALRAANSGLKNEIERRKGMEGQILEVSDREQQRLGQELHDGLCQHLTAVAFMARSVALRLENHRVVDAKDIEKIAELVNAAASDTRDLSRALHRMDVDAAGFVTALEDLVDREIWKTPCRLKIEESFHVEGDAVAAQLYRIAREAVINANKHACAKEIVVKLERSSRGMVLRVVDDGVGFSSEPKLRQGLGLHIMNYRARLLGGRLEIDSPKKGGTRVSCYLPNGEVQSHQKGGAARTGFHGKIAKALATIL